MNDQPTSDDPAAQPVPDDFRHPDGTTDWKAFVLAIREWWDRAPEQG